MADTKETLDQAVQRIAKDNMAELSCMLFGNTAHIEGRSILEAAIRQGIAWAYRDAAEICRDSESWEEAAARVQERAEEVVAND